MKISVICPVLNEVDFIGYSVMAALPWIHEFVYTLDEKSDDGTRELLHHVKDKYAHEKLVIIDHPSFHPHDMAAYNGAFNRGIEVMTGDTAFFLHPDMIITDGAELKSGPLAWWTAMTSYAGDMKTIITKGRANKWKNIHANKFGLRYCGQYGSQNEDFYHTDITGKSLKHYGTEFSKHPFQVEDSGIKINHYCEVKGYKRRLEKMKLCLKTLVPEATDGWVEEQSVNHPRVTLEPSSKVFGEFKFAASETPIPDVFEKYKEFQQFNKKENVWPYQEPQSRQPLQTEPISF